MEQTEHPDSTSQNEKGGGELTPSPIQSVAAGLDEIDRILHQMLFLAELSAGDGTVDRESLQKVLEQLQAKIDRIADQLESI